MDANPNLLKDNNLNVEPSQSKSVIDIVPQPEAEVDFGKRLKRTIQKALSGLRRKIDSFDGSGEALKIEASKYDLDQDGADQVIAKINLAKAQAKEAAAQTEQEIKKIQEQTGIVPDTFDIGNKIYWQGKEWEALNNDEGGILLKTIGADGQAEFLKIEENKLREMMEQEKAALRKDEASLPPVPEQPVNPVDNQEKRPIPPDSSVNQPENKSASEPAPGQQQPDLLKLKDNIELGQEADKLDQEKMRQELGQSLNDTVIASLLNVKAGRNEENQAIEKMAETLQQKGYFNINEQELKKKCAEMYHTMKAQIAVEAKSQTSKTEIANKILLAGNKSLGYIALGGLGSALLTPLGGAALVGGVRIIDSYLSGRFINQKKINQYKEQLAANPNQRDLVGDLITLVASSKRADLEMAKGEKPPQNAQEYKDRNLRFLLNKQDLDQEFKKLPDEQKEAMAEQLAVMQSLEDALQLRQKEIEEQRSVTTGGKISAGWERFTNAAGDFFNKEPFNILKVPLNILRADSTYLGETGRAMTSTGVAIGIGLALREAAKSAPVFKAVLGAWVGYRVGKATEKFIFSKNRPELIIAGLFGSLDKELPQDQRGKVLTEARAHLEAVKETSENKIQLAKWKAELTQHQMNYVAGITSLELFRGGNFEQASADFNKFVLESDYQPAKEGIEAETRASKIKKVGLVLGATALGALSSEILTHIASARTAEASTTKPPEAAVFADYVQAPIKAEVAPSDDIPIPSSEPKEFSQPEDVPVIPRPPQVSIEETPIPASAEIKPAVPAVAVETIKPDSGIMAGEVKHKNFFGAAYDWAMEKIKGESSEPGKEQADEVLKQLKAGGKFNTATLEFPARNDGQFLVTFKEADLSGNINDRVVEVGKGGSIESTVRAFLAEQYQKDPNYDSSRFLDISAKEIKPIESVSLNNLPSAPGAVALNSRGGLATVNVSAAGVMAETAQMASPFGHLEYQGGHSIWEEAEKQLAVRFKEQFASLGGGDVRTQQALEIFNTDRVKDVIVAHPAHYGLPSDMDFTRMSEQQIKTLNWDKALQDAFEHKGLTTSLPAEHVASIVSGGVKETTPTVDLPERPMPEIQKETGQKIDAPVFDIKSAPVIEAVQTEAELNSPPALVDIKEPLVSADSLIMPGALEEPLAEAKSGGLIAGVKWPDQVNNILNEKDLPAAHIESWLNSSPDNEYRIRGSVGEVLFVKDGQGGLYFNYDDKPLADHTFNKIGSDKLYIISEVTANEPKEVISLNIKVDSVLNNANNIGSAVLVHKDSGRIFDNLGNPLSGEKIMPSGRYGYDIIKGGQTHQLIYNWSENNLTEVTEAPPVMPKTEAEPAVQEAITIEPKAGKISGPEAILEPLGINVETAKIQLSDGIASIPWGHVVEAREDGVIQIKAGEMTYDLTPITGQPPGVYEYNIVGQGTSLPDGSVKIEKGALEFTRDYMALEKSAQKFSDAEIIKNPLSGHPPESRDFNYYQDLQRQLNAVDHLKLEMKPKDSQIFLTIIDENKERVIKETAQFRLPNFYAQAYELRTDPDNQALRLLNNKNEETVLFLKLNDENEIIASSSPRFTSSRRLEDYFFDVAPKLKELSGPADVEFNYEYAFDGNAFKKMQAGGVKIFGDTIDFGGGQLEVFDDSTARLTFQSTNKANEILVICHNQDGTNDTLTYRVVDPNQAPIPTDKPPIPESEIPKPEVKLNKEQINIKLDAEQIKLEPIANVKFEYPLSARNATGQEIIKNWGLQFEGDIIRVPSAPGQKPFEFGFDKQTEGVEIIKVDDKTIKFKVINNAAGNYNITEQTCDRYLDPKDGQNKVRMGTNFEFDPGAYEALKPNVRGHSVEVFGRTLVYDDFEVVKMTLLPGDKLQVELQNIIGGEWKTQRTETIDLDDLHIVHKADTPQEVSRAN